MLGKGYILIIIFLIVSTITLPLSFEQQSNGIPPWIKKVAGFWSENNTTDQEFGNAIEFLIENEIISISFIEKLKEENQKLKKDKIELEDTIKSLRSQPLPRFEPITISPSYDIPPWIKEVAGLWSENNTTDQEFGNAIEFLIENEIIIISLKEENIKLKQENLALSDAVKKIISGTSVEKRDPFVTNIGFSTDKDTYQTGEPVLIFGRVEEKRADSLITVNVINPNGDIIILEHVPVDNSNSFLLELKTYASSLWHLTGTYTIKVFYVSENIMEEKEIEFTVSEDFQINPTNNSIEVSGTSFIIDYNMIGGIILSITPDNDLEILNIAISTSSDGELTITLPRELIDAKSANGDDDDFFVLVDGIQKAVLDTATTQERILIIPVPLGASEIKVIGTFIAS